MHTAKTSYMMRGSVSGGMSSKFVWSPHVIMSFQQSSSHFCNQNTFNLQDWLTFIACWSLIKIFCQNRMLNICWFQNNKETKTRHVSLKDEMWSQNKNATFHNNMIDNSSPFLDQLFWPYLCFAEQLRSLVILRMFWWQNDRWHHLSQTQLDSWNSCLFNWNGPGTLHDIHIWFELYHGGCMQIYRNGCNKSGI
jgi:hypothetical protein